MCINIFFLLLLINFNKGVACSTFFVLLWLLHVSHFNFTGFKRSLITRLDDIKLAINNVDTKLTTLLAFQAPPEEMMVSDELMQPLASIDEVEALEAKLKENPQSRKVMVIIRMLLYLHAKLIIYFLSDSHPSTPCRQRRCIQHRPKSAAETNEKHSDAALFAERKEEESFFQRPIFICCDPEWVCEK